ncbi:ankyrin repeat domain-containing protein [Mycoavidus sp. B2-EB]|uniref:ankyrin repeat domain-containing protein n=1 Tax=Mycoavidus sp. B2-EB TaxID=2651972 RepID=UPI00162365D3|nr:ankyrin repeat domain-containing protein [Mycoavidus sp. B2-EB]BBO59752.1 hypothetical protein MPB2EB_0877 [Mycoavidus sp. B2-EB]
MNGVDKRRRNDNQIQNQGPVPRQEKRARPGPPFLNNSSLPNNRPQLSPEALKAQQDAQTKIINLSKQRLNLWKNKNDNSYQINSKSVNIDTTDTLINDGVGSDLTSHIDNAAQFTNPESIKSPNNNSHPSDSEILDTDQTGILTNIGINNDLSYSTDNLFDLDPFLNDVQREIHVHTVPISDRQGISSEAEIPEFTEDWISESLFAQNSSAQQLGDNKITDPFKNPPEDSYIYQTPSTFHAEEISQPENEENQVFFRNKLKEFISLKEFYLNNKIDVHQLNRNQKLFLAQNMTKEEKQKSLYIAAEQQDEEMIRFLLNRGVDVNEKDISGNCAIHIAASKNDIDILGRLYRKQADFSVLNKENKTVLQIASDSKSTKAIQFLKQLYFSGTFIPNTDLDMETLIKAMDLPERIEATYQAVKQDNKNMIVNLLKSGGYNLT